MSLVRWPIVLLVLAPLAMAAPVPKEFKAKKGDYFPTTVGTSWEYVVEATGAADHSREVTAETRQEDGSRMAEFKWTSQGGSYGELTTYRADPNGFARIGFGKGQKFEVPYQMLKLDVKPGDTWDAGISRRVVRDEEFCTRGDDETITTPAGKFECISVRYGKTASHIYWYAPGVGLVKWKNGEKVIVLSKFTPAREAKK